MGLLNDAGYVIDYVSEYIVFATRGMFPLLKSRLSEFTFLLFCFIGMFGAICFFPYLTLTLYLLEDSMLGRSTT